MKYVIVVILLSNIMWSQNIDSHKWKERVVLISADQNNKELADLQFSLFEQAQEELQDRKIVIYMCIDKVCIFYDGEKQSKSFQAKTEIKGFNTVLIGLDGSEKYNSNEVQKATVFFSLIDTMPMRQQELKQQDRGQ